MNKILPIILVVVLSGCMHHINADKIFKNERFDTAYINIIKEAKIGESLIDSGMARFGEGIRVKGDIVSKANFSDMGFRTSQRTAFLSSTHTGDKCYGPFEGVIELSTTLFIETESEGRMDLCVNNNDKLYIALGYGRQGVIQNEFQIIPDMIDENYNDNYMQKFVYDGLDNNYIKFIHEEYKMKFIKPNMSQGIQFDLRDSKVINFKGLQIQIIDANSNLVKYKILKTFSQKDTINK